MNRKIILFRHSRRTYTPHGGFTLLEILVSTAVLAVLLLLLFAMLDGASRLWSDGERRRGSSREARAGLKMIAEDLHSAVLSADPATLRIIPSREQGYGDQLYFLVSHPDEEGESGTKGDLCATGYLVAPDSQDRGVRNLYRFHATPVQVAAAIKQGGEGIMELYSRAASGDAAGTELLARNIRTLEVRDALPSGDPQRHPAELFISLSAIGGEIAGTLASDPGAVQRNERLIRQHLQRYSTTVHLPPIREQPVQP